MGELKYIEIKNKLINRKFKSQQEKRELIFPLLLLAFESRKHGDFAKETPTNN